MAQALAFLACRMVYLLQPFAAVFLQLFALPEYFFALGSCMGPLALLSRFSTGVLIARGSPLSLEHDQVACVISSKAAVSIFLLALMEKLHLGL